MKQMICGLALTLLLAPALLAQMPEGDKSGSMAGCAAMMQQHEAMQQHMAEMDAKLQTLVDEMNKAKGSAKVDRMAAVITELVAQRSMMQKQMAEMQPKMMEHMMAHVQSAMVSAASTSMSGCPMMKQGEKTSATVAPAAPPHKH